MTTRTEIAETLGDPDLIAIAARYDQAAATAAPLHRRVRELTARLQSARDDDATAVAVALERGQKIPEPTEPKIRIELDERAREKAAADKVLERVRADWEAVICERAPGLTRDVMAAKLAAASEQLDSVLAALADTLETFNDAYRFLNWARSVERYADPGTPEISIFPGSPSDSVVSLEVTGGYAVTANQLTDLIRIAANGLIGRASAAGT